MPAKHEPTDETRAQVKALAGFGIREDEIAKYVGIAPKTLRKHYRHELDVGVTQANINIAQSLYQQAMNGSTSAAIFWLKARAGWREKQEIEHTGRDGGPIEVSDAKARLASKLSADGDAAS